MSEVYDDRPCSLGEGPLWHPVRKQLFWFDIIGKRLRSRVGDTPLEWQFDEHVSAAGWVDKSQLLIASETQLFLFDVDAGTSRHVIPLEADNPVTRSNDGRVDPWGGFWIGTMGKAAEPNAGAIYRFYKGELHQLFPDITISNAICFAPDRSHAYYCDTVTGQVMRQPLEAEHGWPEGAASVYMDLRAEGLNPDGAVVDAEGNFWVAQWGASRVAVYGPEGDFRQAVSFAGQHTSCPAFGGEGLSDLFCTTARQGIAQNVLKAEPQNGMTFVARDAGRGQAEHQVIL